ncbi:hypothetical protein Sked_15390 [Sanguibacter keddieii DSM 10542]|uniref:DUF4191 domain-containing protein n=1 Tax=Sanguibacter keddieii (strain ATCC 51767 / DSM 10542 / NCFB 3025 / ST-74) TaxID=446469 RepID=D1BFW3_SANKS|nr:DUF4191 domain-containing protein [Sanguibacter keddieii]ACZ21474.1 hypothetical protein Sked_15390 [Sanguibacter keddieii DSM 10542]
MARKNKDEIAPGVAADAQGAPKKQKKPKKVRWYHQVFQAYKMTYARDRKVPWIMLGVFVGIVALFVGIGLWWGQPVYMSIIGVPFGLLGAMFVLARRAERAQYAEIEGQPGAARAALGTIRRGWSFDEEPAAVDPKTQDLLFRGLGRAGIVLVTEGPSGRVKKLVDAEQRKLSRILSGVPVTVVQCGNGEGQVPLPKLARHVQKLKPKLNKAEVGEVGKRLTALGKIRMPIPKGVDPNRARPDRKGMR